MTLTCPVCDTEFSSPILEECQRLGKLIFCPRGHKIKFLPVQSRHPVEVQVAILERLYAIEVSH